MNSERVRLTFGPNVGV